MDPFEILRQANEAIRLYGKTPEEVEAKLPTLSGGRFHSMNELQTAVRETAGQPGTPEEAAYQVLNEQGGSGATDFLHQAAAGLTANFSDEIRGGLSALVGGDYEEARDAERARLAATRELNPGASILANIAGGAPVALAGGGAGAANLAVGGSKVAGGILGAAATGAGYGAAAGIGEGETAQERTVNGAIGAVLGGTVGGVLGGGAAVVGRLMAGGDAGARAAAILRRELKTAGFGPEDIEQALQRLGSGSVPADLSPNLVAAADDAVTGSANALTGRGGVVDQLYGRGAGRTERLISSLRRASRQGGYEESLLLAKSAVDQARATAYRPLEEAFPEVLGETVQAALRNPRTAAAAHAVDRSIVPRGARPTVQDFLEQFPNIAPDEAEAMVAAGITREAAAREAEMLANAGVAPRAIPGAVAERAAAGDIAGGAEAVVGRPPSFTELQSTLGKLRAAAERAADAKDPDAYIKAMSAAEELREAMGRDIPGFDEAQRLFGPLREALDSHDLGKSMASSDMIDIRATFDNLTKEGKEAFRLGLRTGVEQRLARGVDTGGNVGNRLMQSENNPEYWGEMLKIIAPDEESRAELLTMLARERFWGQTERGVGRNSATARRLLNQELNERIPYPSRHGLLHRGLQRAFIGNQETQQAANKAVGEALLSRTYGPEMIQRILSREVPSGINAGAVGAVGGAGVADQGVRMFGARR